MKLRLQTYLSRHCFEMRPGRLEAMYDHFLGPYLVTSSTSVRSSCGAMRCVSTKTHDCAQVLGLPVASMTP